MPSCEESTRLMSAAMERPLSRGERLALRWHLLMCGACRRFDRHLGWLRRSAQGYVPPEPPEPSADGAPSSDKPEAW